MKTLLALILIVAIAAGAYLFLKSDSPKPDLRSAEDRAAEGARQIADAVRDKFKDLNTAEIKEELEKTGQVVRKKAEQVGAVIKDATADARITAAIKAKLVKESDLPALRISVNTTDGLVTLSGSVDNAEQIKQAMKVALETEGVREVKSTLQVKASK